MKGLSPFASLERLFQQACFRLISPRNFTCADRPLFSGCMVNPRLTRLTRTDKRVGQNNTIRAIRRFAGKIKQWMETHTYETGKSYRNPKHTLKSYRIRWNTSNLLQFPRWSEKGAPAGSGRERVENTVAVKKRAILDAPLYAATVPSTTLRGAHLGTTGRYSGRTGDAV